ncbi:hypothetical protein DIT68_15500 [Brumimicrobium oceani]|uniref:Uncharacterized protein n=2 Tax=Brumimicrobium oceani TaxID=2100725 RepID=A0A2U2X0P7_9FLAO|nr:hypothetical protein DIT68_15500 [Brumimicrobium oceani]
MLFPGYLFSNESQFHYFCPVKQKKHIFLLLLMAIFFISTTGVTVYKHYCSHGGMFYGVYADVAHACDHKEDKQSAKNHDCCATSSETGLTIQEDCCTSDVKMYQIDIDLATNDVKFNFLTDFSFNLSNSALFSIPEFIEISTSNKAPPVLSTLERLSLFQIYLI